jgi:RimJ/RimL family protein N-acetyltransferase
LKVLATDRLILRRLSTDDAEFILELVNDPAFIRFIGDRGVRTLDDARAYILKGPIDMYERLGHGLYAVELAGVPIGAAIGMCGLIKRDALEDVDLGFAFLPQFRGQGYAHEAAAATLAYGREALGLERIAAITSPDNHASARLLEKLGFRFERMLSLAKDDQVKLFASDRKETIMTESTTSLAGRTFKWTFTEGPTAGGTYEHTFEADGSVSFRKVEAGDTGGEGKPTREKKYASFEVAPDVHLVSYLGASGYTLTVAMNLQTGRLYGFASNDKEWHPVSGTLETVK